jgi:ribose transport system permease protein
MKRKLSQVIQFIITYNTIFIFLLILFISALVSESFFTSTNLFNLIRQVTPVGITSMGMLLVILTGGIDLSVGSIVAMTGVLCALFTNMMSLPAALITALISGILLGGISGYLVAFHRMAPFIATLAMMSIVRGLGFIFSKGVPVMVSESATALTDFGSNSFIGIPNPAWILFLVFAITGIVLQYNAFGRIVIAIGSNEESVRLSGIRVPLHKFSVYAILAVYRLLQASY